MRSPEARNLLNEVIKASRVFAEIEWGGVIYRESFTALQEALAAYDAFCAERHYSLSLDLVSSSTATDYASETQTKADHFKLPLGR